MRALVYLLLTSLVTSLALAAWLWWALLSPYGYQRPACLPPVPAGSHQVFVYGTLTQAPVRWLVYGRTGTPQPAALPGFRRQGLDLTPEAGATVAGLLLTVNASELARLDRYERLGERYGRHRVTLAQGQSAWVYRRLEASEEGFAGTSACAAVERL